MNPSPPPKTILLIKVATSGFSPENDTILEVACILADAGTLDVIDTCNVVVRHPAGSVRAHDFHEGLLAECADPERSTMRAAEGFLLAGQWTTADVVCSRALDFHMKFLAKHMPTLHAALIKYSKPQLELKALEVLHVAADGTPFVSTAPKTYRAADEVLAAYEELVFLRTGVSL